MGLLVRIDQIYASMLAAVLSAPLVAAGVTWWSPDSAPLTPPYGSNQGAGTIQWFTVYPDSYEHNGNSRTTTSTVPPPENSQFSGGYPIVDLRT